VKAPRSGAKAPSFEAEHASGKLSLASVKGQWVVLYFYPKDDTPGCTTEACEFAKAHGAIKKHDAVLLGVSPDSTSRHTKFAAKFGLPFMLLSDPEHELCLKYGAWGEKTLYGRKFMGVLRSTFIIDPRGKIAWHWPKVKPAGHAVEVLKKLKEIQAS